MNDLISRAELFNRLATVHTLGDAYAVIQDMPTAYSDEDIQKLQDMEQAQFDEIERLTMESIVRCKDCKHQRKIYHKDARRKDGGYYICGCDLTDGYSHVCLDDDFCSKAERRENHEAD